MAKKKTKSESKADKELLKKVRKRFTLMTDADNRNRENAMEDMKFTNVPGAQWDENMKLERGDRPCYEFNKLRITCKRIINEMRANRPQGKVRGVEDSDKDTADIYEGLIRNIWNNSDGDTVIDSAAEYQVAGGMGAWRIITKYATDNTFDQDIVIEPIHNPFCLYADPSAKDQLKRDADDWIYTEKISTKAFEEKYGDIEKVDWESTQFDDDTEWYDDEDTRVCEYWWKEPVKKEIWQLEDGKVVDSGSDEAALIDQAQIKQRRVIETSKIKMAICSGDAVLEGPTDWAGSKHPFIMVYGEYMIIDGRIEWFGVPRFAKDAQRSYNISRTAISETVAGTPLSSIWATSTQAAGHTSKWAEAHQKNFPFRLYNPDPAAPGPPVRTGGADVPVALMQLSGMDSEDIKAVTGIQSADMGAPNNATSGRQEIARQQQGQLATFNYPDNMAKGIRRTWEILIDLIPQIYDTERSIRILGGDDAEDFVKINSFETDPETGEQIKVHDLSEGSYDVTITVGPGYATKRQEATEMYMGLTQGNPELMNMAGDLIFKSMDLPYAEEMAERWKTILPPPIQELLNKDAKIPPEVKNMMQQAEQAMQQVQAMGQEVQQAAAEAEKEKSLNEKDKADLKTMMANIKTEEAKFEAKVANELADLAQKKLTAQENVVETGESIEVIRVMSEQFMEYATEAIRVIEEKSDEVTKPPKVVRIESHRENGNLVAVPVYKETDEHKIKSEAQPREVLRIESQRINGKLVAVPVYKEPDQEAPGLNIEETRKND